MTLVGERLHPYSRRLEERVVRLTNQPADQKKPEPKSSTTPRSRRGRGVLKTLVLSLFAVLFLTSGWFTYKIAAASGKIFTANSTGGSPLLHGKKPKNDETARINILLLGIGGAGHDGPNLTDTIQVASIDAKTKKITMLSIPRDLYVQVPGSTQHVKINEVHAIGEDNGYPGGGPALAKEEISKILDVPIHYFIRADFSGFKDIVDSVGGVDVTVEQRLYDPYFPAGESTGYEVLDIQPGIHHFDGTTALKYVRSRETTSDFERSKRQQQVMVAVRDKATSLQYLSNPTKISRLIDITGEHVKTDLSIGELQKLGTIVKDIPVGGVNSKVLDNAPNGLLYDSTGPSGAFILLPRAGTYGDIQQFANQLFNGTSISAEKAGVEVQNASGRAGLAAQEGTILTGYGYNVVGTTNGDQPSDTTVIYDYSNGTKPGTVANLQKRYKCQVIKQTTAPTPGIDVRVVIGSDYARASTKEAGSNLYGQ